MNAPAAGVSVQVTRQRRRRLALFVGVFLVGVLVGLLLSPRCRQCLGGTARVRGDQTGGTGQGPPSKIALGRGTGEGGSGASQASGDTQGKGHTGEASGVGGSASAGGGRGTGQAGGGELQQGQDASDPLRTAVLRRAQGLQGGAGDPPPAAAETAAGKVLSAPDFTYDRTALPRYPNTNQVVSALAYPHPGDTQTWNSSVGMTTPDTFDSVVAWYQAQLPSGWHAQVMGDMQQGAQQLSVESISAMLGAAASPAGNPSAPAGSAAGASDPDKRVQVAVFEPPAGASGKPGVMVARHGQQPVTILLGARSP